MITPEYVDHRPVAAFELRATDVGVVMRHGDGPDDCDMLGAREAVVYEENGFFHLFYDGAGKKGWRASLAVSRDLTHWEKKGPVLELGAAGTPDSAAATSPWAIREGTTWHMFFLGTPNAAPAPDFTPRFPYLTLKASAPRLSGPWTKSYDITPFRPKPDTWYATTASPGYIIRQKSEYLQFFSGSNKTAARGTLRTLGVARTKDLNGTWTVDPEPILPPEEQIENSSLYFEPTSQLWFLFTNHIGCDLAANGRLHEYTDAIWVYWTKDPLHWNPVNKAVVLDGSNCAWSSRCIGMPAVVEYHSRLALLYDAPGGDSTSHMNRDVGLAWLNLPLRPPSSVGSSASKKPESPAPIQR